MKTFKNTNFKSRDYECTNIVACVGHMKPNSDNWVMCNSSVLSNLTKLYTQNGITYYGYL